MTPRCYLVGTDTGVGKTTVLVALVHAARVAGLRVLPFKPVASGGALASDPERLAAAYGLANAEAALLCPLRFEAPVAPGLALDSARFLACPRPPSDPAPLAEVQTALARAEARFKPDLTIVEGAGGLYVPMPGGDLQPAWIHALAPHALVVGRDALGTINHAVLTLRALAAENLSVLGFVLSAVDAEDDPSRVHNHRVIECLTGATWLGTLAHEEHDSGTFPAPELWARLRRG